LAATVRIVGLQFSNKGIKNLKCTHMEGLKHTVLMPSFMADFID
jgi:hypothetical protein